MNQTDRFERDLAAWFVDTAAPRTPDYVNDILRQTARARQRPRWTFPERWLPMSVISLGRLTPKPVPWRTVGLLAVLALLLAAALGLIAGSRPRVPAPFGPAANGLIAYAASGDIYVGNPATGKATAIATGPDFDTDPKFSPDGTRIAFLRRVGEASANRYNLVVAAADGSGARSVATGSVYPGDTVQWAPDGASLLVNSFTSNDLRLYDATREAEPQVLATLVSVDAGAFRPPDGKQLLFRRVGSIKGLYVMNIDGSHIRPLVELDQPTDNDELVAAQWSPDGSLVAVPMTLARDPRQVRIHIMNADGTKVRELTGAPGLMYENNPVWSPDGTRIAFERWSLDATMGQPNIMPLGIRRLDAGPIVDAGPVPPGQGGILFGWSPDGSKLLAIPGSQGSHHLLIDPERGSSDALRFDSDPFSRPSWQRLAP